jgi:hypothetical protein
MSLPEEGALEPENTQQGPVKPQSGSLLCVPIGCQPKASSSGRDVRCVLPDHRPVQGRWPRTGGGANICQYKCSS